MSNKQFIDLDNAREQEQIQVMKDIAKENHCPFCLKNLKKYHKHPILKETKHWLLTKNQWPYKYTKYHLLIIYKKHATKLSELSSDAGKELFDLVKWTEKKYQVPGGAWAMRFGDTDYSAGSVNHLHVQFIEPDIKAKGYQSVRIKVGKSPNKL
ncbi:MAG: hypothetical protein PVJ09_01950 [Candidatus Woesebacteria bacterium]|jgi:diadenosine tetraphosphate (Ap4A) HIT family hydrolase